MLFILFSTCLSSKASAGLIVGGLYNDESGITWQYMGAFDLTDGDRWNNANGDDTYGDNATPYNGIEAASLLFGVLDALSEYALSSTIFQESEKYTVNHKAWYDGYATYIQEKSESFTADNNNDGLYNTAGDFSAYIRDRGIAGEHINHVFKTATVPEPATFAIFAFALFGLTAQRFKRQ